MGKKCSKSKKGTVMKMKTFIGLITASLLISFCTWIEIDANAADDHVRFEHLTPEDGLSGKFIPSILQDKQGFIWFASNSGLNKYDGNEFTVYVHNPEDLHSLSYSEINTLYEDHKGTLWVGTTNGLNRLDRASDRFSRYTLNG
ncbi:MAG: hypothetical protein HQM11_03600 [SAR324 cluster bacterium]|nr:hypothetical protein [SAR324 cluster bacterium]